jgi:flagellar biosynthesis protein FlhF
MKLKSYFADAVETALAQARGELGPEAMLLNSRRTSPEYSHLGAYEIVCAVAPEFGTGRDAPYGTPPRSDRQSQRLSQEVAELRQQMERLASNLARSSAGISHVAANPALADAFSRLIEAELDPDLAHDIVLRAGPEAPLESIHRELSSRIAVDASLGLAGEKNRVVALAGPPGGGKTTCIAKLAVRFGLGARRSCHLLTLDTERIGAAEQLRTYAAILGIGFDVIETPAALAQALEEHRLKDLVLIDTPGLSRNDGDAREELARMLGSSPRIETQLVLPASMRSLDMRRAIEECDGLTPGKLIFTRLDETRVFGPILNQSARAGKPVSFLSFGQRVPEDLGPATAAGIAGLIVRGEAGWRAADAAAAA